MRRPSRTQLFGWAWVALALALALHVADAATHDFLATYNPSAEAMRARLGLPFPPVFSFRVWLGGLVVAVLGLLACAPLAFAASRPVAWLAAGLGLLMIGNGVAHVGGSLLFGRLTPGVLSSPVLVVCAAALLVTAVRVLRPAPVPRPG